MTEPTQDACPSRSKYERGPLPHLYTSHVRITDPSGEVVFDADVCSWCEASRGGGADRREADGRIRPRSAGP